MMKKRSSRIGYGEGRQGRERVRKGDWWKERGVIEAYREVETFFHALLLHECSQTEMVVVLKWS